MGKLAKRARDIREKIDPAKLYAIDDAVTILSELSSVKFTESIDVSINLGVDPKKSDQVVRGSTVLPNGTGKDVRVAVFAQGDKADEAKNAGADIVGMEDLADTIRSGNLDFGVVIASPDAMRLVGQLGQVLGPRGLMPNPRLGTVTSEVGEAVKNAKAGQVRFRTDRNGIIHGGLGKIGFEPGQIKENLEALLADLKKANIKIKYVDLGGGMSIPYDFKETKFPLKKYASNVYNFKKKNNVKIIFEPGRFLSGNVGIIISKIIYIKEGAKKKFIVTDAAMNDLIRTALYDANHTILPINRRKEIKSKIEFVGPICESSDKFGEYKKFSKLEESDYICITNTGAYGRSLSSNYNMRPLIAELLIKNNKILIIRKRQNINQIS